MNYPFNSLVVLCAILFSFANLSAASILSETDLEISMSADNPDAGIYQYITITTTVENTGENAANEIVLAFNIPSGAAIAGEFTPEVSQGELSDVYGGSLVGTWDVGTLSVGEAATFSLTFFSLADSNTFYGQIQSMAMTDSDSSPGNGICCEGLEDDEAFLTFPAGNDGGGGEGPTCDLEEAYVEVSDCFDNGTPDDFSDDYFDVTFRVDGEGSYFVKGPFGSAYEDTLEYTSGFHTLYNIPGGLSNTNSGYEIKFEDDSNLMFCDTIVQFAGPCTQTIGFGDLELYVATADGVEMPGIYSTGTAVFTFKNTSNLPAINVSARMDKNALNYTNFPELSEGEVLNFYDSDDSFNWVVSELLPDEEATLTVGVFTLAEDYRIFSQVTGASIFPDIDSSPNNGNGIFPQEDDEAVYQKDLQIETGLSDIVVIDLVLENEAVVQGEFLNYSYTVKNIGEEISEPFNIVEQRSFGISYSSGNYQINNRLIPTLLPDEEIIIESTFASQTSNPHNYNIIVFADVDEVIVETDESNNEIFEPFFISSPDCAYGIESYEYVCDVNEWGEPIVGLDVTFYNDVETNIHRYITPGEDGLYQSILTGEPFRIAESAIGETYILEYRGSEDCTTKIVEFNIPELIICEETDPDALLDLTIGSIEIDDGFFYTGGIDTTNYSFAYIGDTINYSFSIVNNGNTFINETVTIRTNLSTDSILSPDDIVVEERTIPLLLAAGDSLIIYSENPVLPSNQVGGTRRLLVFLDINDEIIEENEDNNFDYGLFVYTEPPCILNITEENYTCYYLSDTDTLLALTFKVETFDGMSAEYLFGGGFNFWEPESIENGELSDTILLSPGSDGYIYFEVADHPTGCYGAVDLNAPNEIDCSEAAECSITDSSVTNVQCTESEISFDFMPVGISVLPTSLTVSSVGSSPTQSYDNLPEGILQSLSFNRQSDTTFFHAAASSTFINNISGYCNDTFGLVCPTIPEPGFVDIELDVTESSALGIYEQGEVTFTVSNKGTEMATGVLIPFRREESELNVVGSPVVTYGFTQFFWSTGALWNVGNLSPGQSESITINLFTLKSDFVYYAYVSEQNEVDIDSSPGFQYMQGEDDEAFFTGQAVGSSNLADLNINGLEINSNYLNPIEILTYQFDIRNDGNVSTTTVVTAGVYVSMDVIFDSSDVFVDTHTTQNTIGANEEESITGSFNVADYNLLPGDYYLIAADNLDNEIEEENTETNYQAIAFEIIDPDNCSISIINPDFLCQQSEEMYEIIFDVEVENVTSDFFALSYVLNGNTVDRDLDNGSVVIENIPYDVENTLIVSDLENPLCADTLIFDYTEDCMNAEALMPDLEVTLEVSTLTPQLYVPFSATITLSNTGNAAATDVDVRFQYPYNPNTLTIVGENPYEATAGDVDWYAGWWKFTEVAAGATEVLTVNYYPFATGTPYINAFVLNMNEEDPDSSPDGCCTSGEDDEAIAYLTISNNFSDDNTENRNDVELRVYPNPVSDRLIIRGQSGILYLNDTAGNTILTEPTDGDLSLDIAHLPIGIYFLTLQTETDNSMVRVVKM